MSPPPPADASDAAAEAGAELPSVLRGREPTPVPSTKELTSDRDDRTPTIEITDEMPVLQGAPKKETLKLFPYSGNMGAAVPTPMPPAPSEPGTRDPHQPTPKARPAVSDRARAQGPIPRDPAAVHAALDPLLAWMPEEQRPEVTRQLLCGEYDGVLRILSEHRQRYPKNLTISKAIEVVEDAAASRLLHDLGPLNSEIIVVGAEAAGRGNIGALLRLARQAATLGELLEKTPLGRVRTLQLVSQLVKEGTLAVRTVAKPTGFGVGALSSPSVETLKRRMSVEMPAVLGSFAEVKAVADPPPSDEGDADALFAQLERATLPDPSEVAASLQKLRDRNLTPAVRPRVPSERKRFDDRVDEDGGSAPTEENISEKPPAVRDRASSQSMARIDGDAPRATSDAPTPQASKLELARTGASKSDPPASNANEAASKDAAPNAAPHADGSEKETSSGQADAPSEDGGMSLAAIIDADASGAAQASTDDASAEDKPARKSVVPDAALYAELKRLRPEPIREGEDRVRPSPPFLLLAVGAIGLIAIALSLYALFGRQPEQRPPSPIPAEPKRVPTSEPTTPPPAPTPAPTAPPTQATQTAAVAEEVTLEVEVSPRYAQVYLDGTLLTKPFKRTIAKDDRKHELRIEAGGYKTQTRTFTMKGDTSFVVALEPIIGRKKDPGVAPPDDGAVYP